MQDNTRLPSGFEGQVLRKVETLFDRYGTPDHREVVTDTDEANVITSAIGGSRLHRPLLDLDLPAILLPSSTPDHFHLYLDAPMSWRQYKRLLKALYKAGVIEPGYYWASKRRGYSSLRVPWLRKAQEAGLV